MKEERRLEADFTNVKLEARPFAEAIVSLIPRIDIPAIQNQMSRMSLYDLVKCDRTIIVPIMGSVFNKETCEIHAPIIIKHKNWQKTLDRYASKGMFCIPLPLSYEIKSEYKNKLQNVNLTGYAGIDIIVDSIETLTTTELLNTVAEGYMDYYYSNINEY